jgi:hypothetical protein
VVAVHVRVCGGAARAVPESLLQDLHDLEVGYVVFIDNAVQERNPRILVFEGTCPKLLPLQHY